MTEAWDPAEEAQNKIWRPMVGEPLFGTKYLIIAKLGEGGMGEVFEVVKPPQIMGVLKRMTRAMAKIPKAKELFLSEVQALADLEHPHVVRVHDFDTDGYGVPFMVMERLSGRTVADLIDKRGKVDPEEAYEIVRQLLSALDCAHSHEPAVIHRDIKPENIFLHQPRHGPPILKLIDFGLAAESGLVELTFAGSAHYAAPEQILGRPISPVTDLYAVGGVLYEMLSGRMPYDEPTLSEVGRVKITESPKPIRTLAPWVPEEVAKLVMSALDMDPAKRPTNAKAFRKALDSAIGYKEEESRSVGGRAAIPAVTKVKVKVPLPDTPPASAAASARSAKGGFSTATLVHSGLPTPGSSWAVVWREIVAGVFVGAVLLGALHLVLGSR
jgi:eukaryotic-like serine/threonine-protein kinase